MDSYNQKLFQTLYWEAEKLFTAVDDAYNEKIAGEDLPSLKDKLESLAWRAYTASCDFNCEASEDYVKHMEKQVHRDHEDYQSGFEDGYQEAKTDIKEELEEKLEGSEHHD